MSKFKDDLSQAHDNGIYFPTRTIFLTGEVNIELYENFIKNVHALDSTTGLITVKINSDGGDVIEGRAIYDAIKNCKNEVRGVVYGQASSIASIILQACDHRFMTENSYLMTHIGSGQSASIGDHPRNKERWDEYDKYLEKWMEDVYLEKIKINKKRFTRNQLKSMLQWDKIFFPKDALEYNLVDSIGDPQ